MSVKEDAINFCAGAAAGALVTGSAVVATAGAALVTGGAVAALVCAVDTDIKPLPFATGCLTGIAGIFYMVATLNGAQKPKAPPAPAEAPTLQQSGPCRPMSQNQTTYKGATGLVFVIPRPPHGLTLS